MRYNMSTLDAQAQPSVGPAADMHAVAARATIKTTTITG
jgi:hypothetical protein